MVVEVLGRLMLEVVLQGATVIVAAVMPLTVYIFMLTAFLFFLLHDILLGRHLAIINECG